MAAAGMRSPHPFAVFGYHMTGRAGALAGV
jgi:hypothetical protein